ncbi:MAG: F0F1 ATP synthase subunit epsilon [Candidatus Nanopelagicales bacterium]
MGELIVSLVAMDRPVWSGNAKMVVATTPEGEIGILPGHEPILALLVDGAVRIKPVEGEEIGAAVHGGFFSVAQDKVAILAETAELAGEIDVARAQRALERIMADGTVDRGEKAAEVRARIRLKAAIGSEARVMHRGG